MFSGMCHAVGAKTPCALTRAAEGFFFDRSVLMVAKKKPASAPYKSVEEYLRKLAGRIVDIVDKLIERHGHYGTE